MMDFTPRKTSEMVFSNNTSRTSIHGILDGELPFPKNGISGLLFYGVYGSGKTTYANIFCNELEIVRGGKQGTANIELIDCCIINNVHIVVFAGGFPKKSKIEKLKSKNIKTICFATTIVIARKMIQT